MTLPDLSAPATGTPWLRPESYWPALTEATRQLDTPIAALHLGALRHNTHDMLRRAGGTPIRVASKSIRVRGVLEAILAVPGYRGVLAYTLAEALWLAESIEDVVVGYPSVDRAAIAALCRSALLASRVTLMVDSLAQLDLIDAVIPPHRREVIRLCIELDAGWRNPVLGHLGVLRSPVHTAQEAREVAAAIVARPGFALVGLMAYESQVAGLGDRPAGRGPRALTTGIVNRWVRRHSIAELGVRRAAAVAAVREVAPIDFVNGGGTGSLESTHADASVTDIAAGSGFFGGHLFDNYSAFTPAPAAAFALSVVRKPSPDTATLLGGGWVASGPPGTDRLPAVAWPPGLAVVPREAAGEVQTPLSGPGAAALDVGDRVWLRHTKSGELSEHVTEFAVVDDGRVVDLLPTYRGEGKAFL
ncbi:MULTISPECIES: alanine racemase [unclassified Cryobacterium]|uniref:alanine racemase n=1 Tax=unclassified Cryobacterium TaxID=2649013 RepID=UPI002AB48E90|nr:MULTISPECIES: alanine racemase [unclassified Cryobacterium]MDY7543096.1 alanine racemase [Cryobacterium sp. 5B3]MEA9999903.1 alanine racemase [Cryobacterium sp. RTS3]MEB0265667.1 alanine racemase [Cryobacterium sp. 10I5]MEB0274453.1 alanine racemase [Cryobacterium sp. 5B3]